MSHANWNLEQLEYALRSRKEIKAWTVTQETLQRHERYFLLDSGTLTVDQDRSVQAQTIRVRLYVYLDQPGRQGEIQKKLFKTLPLNAQLQAAILAALQTDSQAWELPRELPAILAHPKTADPRISEDIHRAADLLTSKMRTIVGQARQTAFNSAELFLSSHDTETHLSNGFTHRFTQTRVYAEAAYSCPSDEYLNSRWAVNLDDLELESLFEECSNRAAHSLSVSRPLPGKYPVLIDADVLEKIFNRYLAQLSGANCYLSLPFVKPGADLIPGAIGDLLTLTLDPLLDYGGDTCAVSTQGLPQAPLELVKDNKVQATLLDKQYADYLGQTSTTSRGNLLLKPGTLNYPELTRSAPQVLEVLQFSALNFDPNSATFSSEIRLARLFDNKTGALTYIKGGSLSGSIPENFSNVRFSKECVKRSSFHSDQPTGQGYFGPAFALLNDVSVVG